MKKHAKEKPAGWLAELADAAKLRHYAQGLEWQRALDWARENWSEWWD